MRNLSSVTLDKLSQPYGLESFLIASVQWVKGGQWFYYSDKIIDDLSLGINGIIVSLDNIDDQANFEGVGITSNFKISLDDTDGYIKTIFNNNDIHKASVRIYQWFEGIAWSDKFLVAEGQIATPIIWSESQRILTFDVIEQVNDNEIGFSPESGIFPQVHEDLLGKAWPLAFGTPQYIPAVPTQEIPTGSTTIPFGIPDPTLPLQIAKDTGDAAGLREFAALCLFAAAMARFRASDLGLDSRFGISSDQANAEDPQDLSDQYNQMALQAEQQAAQKEAEIFNLAVIYGDQQRWVKDFNVVIGGEKFPQHTPLLLKIGETLFKGQFNGQNVSLEALLLTGPDNNFQLVSLTSYVQADNYIKQGFVFFNAGSQVTIIGNYQLTYIANILPSTVINVYAYQSYNGLRKLSVVPTKYYSVEYLTFTPVSGSALQPLTVTAIVLKKPLTSISYFFNERSILSDEYEQFIAQRVGGPYISHLLPNQTWEDQLYVTLQSPVGPNPVDVIQWLITSYTDKSIDEDSFETAQSSLANYPMNFAFFDRPNVLQAIQEIAYQARCAIWLKEDKFYIKYIPKESDAVATITLDDIITESMEVTCTSTEDLITKYVAEWKPDYIHDKNNIITLRHNINKYGIHEASYNYFCYQDFTNVHKSATFWMIRRCNTWKILNCKLMLKHLNLEIFDTILLDFSSNSRQEFISNSPIRGLIQSINYDSQDYSLQVSIWLPIRLGEMLPYHFAWPADIDENDFFPTFHAIQAGAAGSLTSAFAGQLPNYNGLTFGPRSTGEFDFNTPWINGVTQFAQPRDYGDHRPSDHGDLVQVRPIGQQGPITPVDVPFYEYAYQPNGPKITRQSASSGKNCFPGFIVSGTGSSYVIDVYKRGLSEAPTRYTGARQLQIASAATIDPGSAIIVAIIGKQAYFQHPVFM